MHADFKCVQNIGKLFFSDDDKKWIIKILYYGLNYF